LQWSLKSFKSFSMFAKALALLSFFEIDDLFYVLEDETILDLELFGNRFS